MDGYGKVSAVAEYGGVSARTFRGVWLRDPRLRRVILPSGTILVKFSWVDEYLERFEERPDNTVKQLVDEVVSGLLADTGK